MANRAWMLGLILGLGIALLISVDSKAEDSRLTWIDQDLELKPVTDRIPPRGEPDSEGFTLPTVTARYLAKARAPKIEGDPTALQATGFSIQGNTAFVSYLMAGEVIHGGLDVLNLSDPRRPSIASTWLSRTEEFADVAAQGDWVFAVGATTEGEGGGILAVFKNNSGVLSPVARLPLGGFHANRIRLQRNHAWISVGDNLGLAEVDLSSPERPILKTLVQMPNSLDVVPFSGGVFALGGAESTDLSLWNGSSLGGLFRLASSPTRAPARLALSGDRLYTNAGHSGLSVFKWTGSEIQTLAHKDLPGTGNGIALSGPYSILAQGETGLVVVDHSKTDRPIVMGAFDFGGDNGSANAAAVEKLGSQTTVLIADGLGGFKVLAFAARVPVISEQRVCLFCSDKRDADIKLNGDYSFEVPSEISVVEGTAGQGIATLTIGSVECTYKGASSCEHPMPGTDPWKEGLRYTFLSCSNGATPGAILPANGEIKMKNRRGLWGFNSIIRAFVSLEIALAGSR